MVKIIGILFIVPILLFIISCGDPRAEYCCKKDKDKTLRCYNNSPYYYYSAYEKHECE